MPKNRKRRTSSTENQNPAATFIKKIILGSLFSSALFFILLLILALFVVKTGVSDSMQNILVFVFAAISTFIGIFLSLRKDREKGLLFGVLVAFFAVVFVCLVLLAVLHTLGAKTLLLSALMLLGGALGGIVAVNR